MKTEIDTNLPIRGGFHQLYIYIPVLSYVISLYKSVHRTFLLFKYSLYDLRIILYN